MWQQGTPLPLSLLLPQNLTPEEPAVRWRSPPAQPAAFPASEANTSVR